MAKIKQPAAPAWGILWVTLRANLRASLRATLRRTRRTLSHALSGRKVAPAGGLVTLLMVLLFGLNPLLLWVTTHHGYLLIPSSFGIPLLLPGLRFSPFADQSWTALGCEDFAALLLVGTVFRLLDRHRRLYPGSGRLHRFLVGWGALMAGGLLSGFFRGLVVARVVVGGPLAYFGYPVLGGLFGLVYCLLLGWIVGIAAVFAVVPAAAVERAGDWWAESGRLVLVHLVEPAGELARDWRGKHPDLRLPRPPAGVTDRLGILATTLRARLGGLVAALRARTPASITGRIPSGITGRITSRIANGIPGNLPKLPPIRFPSGLPARIRAGLPKRDAAEPPVGDAAGTAVKPPAKAAGRPRGRTTPRIPGQRSGSRHDENHKASSTSAP